MWACCFDDFPFTGPITVYDFDSSRFEGCSDEIISFFLLRFGGFYKFFSENSKIYSRN